MHRVSRMLTLAALFPVAFALPVVTRPVSQPRPVPPVVREISLLGIDAAAARGVLGYDAALAGPVTAKPLLLTGTRPSPRFSAIGVTWARGRGEAKAVVAVRVRQGGQWQPWHDLDADADHAPDDGTGEPAGARDGTAPYFAGPSDGFQVRIGSAGGRVPRDVRVSLVDPGRSPADAYAGRTPEPGGSAYASANQPAIVTRAQWGADERMRKDKPDYGDTIKMGFVHHTDSGNGYSAAQAPAMVRSVYAFHVRSRGWSDIGYNFVVDRYGRLFEGRAGGIDKPVIGAHTGGFNTDTFGVSLLGNYSRTLPSGPQLTMLERVFAWKFGLHYVNPLGTTTMTSRGGSKYPSGKRVTLHNVSGHRDAGLTSCPGEQTYRRLPSIRGWIRNYMGASIYYPTMSTTRPLYLTTPSVTMRGGIARPQYWQGTVTDRLTGTVLKQGNGYTSSPLVWSWDLKLPGGTLAPPGNYRLTMESWVSGNRARPYVADIEIRSPLPSGVVAESGGVTRILDNGRQSVSSAALLAALRPPGSALTAWPSQLAPFPGPATGLPDGTLVRTPDRTSWAVVNGVRHPVPGAFFSSLKLPTPVAVSTAVAALLPAGAPLADKTRHPDGMLVQSGSTVWRIESGVRRPFSSLVARGGWARGRVTAPAVAGDLALPLGPVLGPIEGAVLRTGSGAGVVSGGTFRPFADASVGSALGYDVPGAPVATSDDLAALGTGAPLTAGAHPTGTLLRNGSAYWEVWGAGRRAFSASLRAFDARVPVAPETGEISSLPAPPTAAPQGLAGRGSDGVVRLVDGGRLVALSPSAANALGYDTATLPALDAADFGVPVAGPLVTTARHPAGTVVTDGTTSWVLDAGVRRRLAASLVPSYRSRPALAATAADLARPVGTPMPPDTGSWLRTQDGARWLVAYDVRRAVSNAVARRLGLDAVTPLDVVLADLTASTASGPAVG